MVYNFFQFFPDGTFKSPDSVDVKRNLDLEENVKVSRETFFSVLDMCHTFMCFEKANSDFSSECLCFSEVQRQWDMAKGSVNFCNSITIFGSILFPPPPCFL